MTLAPVQPDAKIRRGSTPVACAHCGLPVPTGLLSVDGGPSFCCHGCQTAHAVVTSCGLEGYYRLLEQGGRDGAPARTTGRKYAELDSPALQANACRPAAGGLVEVELLLEGVHCTACLWLLERLPRVVSGVVEARLDFRRALIRVVFDPAVVKLSRIAHSLDTLGYPPHLARGAAARESRRIEDRRMLIRMAVAGACAGNIMLLFLALYAGMFEGIEPGFEQLFRVSAMALNTLCLAWPALVFLRGAIAAIRTRSIHLDVPIALGLYLGGAWGIYKTLLGHGDIYFDSISALTFFLLVGRYVQQRQQRYAADAVELLFSITPAFARRRSPATGEFVEVATEELSTGDEVEVRAGDSVPADGVVLSGAGAIDGSLLTGESRAVAVSEGQAVAAGTVSLSGRITVRVEATGQATRIGRLLRLVEEAASRRARIVQRADRWGGWLLWILLALATLTLVLWWREGVSTAIDRAAALLIATCPCGLGLATPLAVTVAIGRAARQGILIKGGDALQSLAEAPGHGLIVLDKTGTITAGRLHVTHWFGAESFKPLVAALEAHSGHPAARALVRDLTPAVPHDAGQASEVCLHPGEGISGLIDGRPVTVGSRALITRLKVSTDSELDAAERRVLAESSSPVFIAVGEQAVAVAGLGDPVRTEARELVREFERRGFEVRMLSGDHPELVAKVADLVGIARDRARGGATPEAKLLAIREWAGARPTIMVGDGVNDAAALAAATVGIAVRGGAEASLSAADVSLGVEGLRPLLSLLDGARALMSTLSVTIVASLGYNVVAAALSITGLISPLLAAIIMPASSLTVTMLCLRSRAFRSPVSRVHEGAV